MWNEITYPFLNYNGTTIEDSEWKSNSILQIIIGYNYLVMLRLKLNRAS